MQITQILVLACTISSSTQLLATFGIQLRPFMIRIQNLISIISSNGYHDLPDSPSFASLHLKTSKKKKTTAHALALLFVTSKEIRCNPKYLNACFTMKRTASVPYSFPQRQWLCPIVHAGSSPPIG
ncbi:hypothetical protein CY34DRAFT_811453 [Suillus luteus UH-Slu-Lm8-n1]|uniref:Uncharacterized protein n=1 Tax=Suillus luteus UH-Slu-Lm8-n1 TaxID=930992 RepID=A0A0D0APC4_9AGAM|nr:hypothetical protein CY34DRAFT_811453 [Suillus luteus UH-Slu-Lm8-n1]